MQCIACMWYAVYALYDLNVVIVLESLMYALKEYAVYACNVEYMSKLYCAKPEE